MTTETCLNCGHDDPHDSTQWVEPGDVAFCRFGKDSCQCTEEDRTIASLRAENERLKKSIHDDCTYAQCEDDDCGMCDVARLRAEVRRLKAATVKALDSDK